MADITLYGISTCDTVRKARKALEGGGHAVTFRDIRAEPLSASEWEVLLTRFGEALVNRRSTTWRGLSEAARSDDPATVLSANPSLMKRPVCNAGEVWTLGWDRAAQDIWI
jgi:arsenate reductase-like glutaredoxin family protein